MDTDMTFRMDSTGKAEMTSTCDQLGMAGSTAFDPFANAFVRTKGMPFSLTLRESPAAVSKEQMGKDTDAILAEFAADYRRMAE